MASINSFLLDKVAKERPPDPIQYVADYLHGMKPEKDSPSPKKSNISPPRSPNKIASQKIELDTTNEDKNTHQNGILEENGHHSRLDDFKVKNFLEVVASSNLFSIFYFQFFFSLLYQIYDF